MKRTNLTNLTSRKSPLIYPGAKTKAKKFIASLIPTEVKKLHSPFLGGGSVELEINYKKIIVSAGDLFIPLIDFWECMLGDCNGRLIPDPNRLADQIQKNYLDNPMTKKRVYTMLRRMGKYKSKWKRASAFFALNRVCWSAVVTERGSMGMASKFKKKNVDYLRTFNAPHFYVEKIDFKDSFRLHPSTTWFSYVDPPYLLPIAEQRFYGHKGELHRGFDHEGLQKILSSRNQWILSYNDCPEIRRMYKKYLILTPEWRYGMNKTGKSSEVLILSRDVEESNYDLLKYTYGICRK